MLSRRDEYGEDARDIQGQFHSRQIRHGFIRKVYGIVGSQLLLTAAVSAAIMKAGPDYLQQNQDMTLGLLLFSMMITIGTMCIFCCAPGLMRKSPQNYIIMFLFTLAESIVVGLVSVQYTQESVMIALGTTTVVVFALSLFACQTKYDFTGCGPYIFVAFMCLFMLGFFCWLGSAVGLSGPAFETMRLCYSIGGALLFSFYIVYDTQLIVGGKHQRSNEFSIDDYAFAAISLYLDIVQLFLFLLRMFGDRR